MELNELKMIKEKFMKEVNFRKLADKSGVTYDYDIMVCGGTGCKSCKSKKVQDKLESVIKAMKLDKKIRVHGVGCFGLCVNGPIVLIYPDDALYEKVSEADCEEIVSSLIQGKLVERLLHHENGVPIAKKEDISFCKKQKYIARNNAAYMSLENILNDYIALDGYSALYKVVHNMTPF